MYKKFYFKEIKMDCELALERVTIGRPQATLYSDDKSNKMAKTVALIVAVDYFIPILTKISYL